MKINLMAPCHFGLEAVTKREIYDLGYEVTEVSDGRVFFDGDEEAVVLGNLHLRTVERLLIHVGSFKATSFEELFQGIKALEWEKYIPKDGRFWVTKATSVKSKLYSIPDIQSITKKAMVTRLGSVYGTDHFEEDGDDYPVRLFLMKDMVVVGLDTSGVSLHKRGYRTQSGQAPLSETLAAALIMLTPWKKDRILVDPFCGSGTFPIEAAMMAANIAPGLQRSFVSEKWTNFISKDQWKDARADAMAEIDMDIDCDIQGYDIDSKVLSVARENAKRAGVEELIHFQRREVKDTSHAKPYGFIITNPPYGKRIGKEDGLFDLYRQLGEAYGRLSDWSMFVITSYEDMNRAINRKPNKVRKVYNGMLRCEYYQYLGAKPPKQRKNIDTTRR